MYLYFNIIETDINTIVNLRVESDMNNSWAYTYSTKKNYQPTISIKLVWRGRISA